jgi:hypothetical protein
MLEKLLRRFIPHDDIGWESVGEKFTRYNLLKCRLLNVYIHQMWSPIAPPVCHSHPWAFVTFILRGGYWETRDNETWVFRKPGRVLYRPAKFRHTVKTVDHYAWSFVITGPYSNQWANHNCRTGEIVQTN